MDLEGSGCGAARRACGGAWAADDAPEWVPLKTNDMLQSMAKLSKFIIWDGGVYGKGGRG